MEIYFITIFPELFEGPLSSGVLGVAARKDAVRYQVVNLREFAVDRHGTVDDYPYGGGAGMVMMAPPIVEAVESILSGEERGEVPVILLSPKGVPFTQSKAESLSRGEKIVFICGRYKSVDERVNELVVTESISIGDYVVSGGELPALVVTDGLVRYLPGVLGDERSRETDSFTVDREFALDAGYYTRPPEFRGLSVPDVLLSGNHAEIERWREGSARENTRRFRPDLIPNRGEKGRKE